MISSLDYDIWKLYFIDVYSPEEIQRIVNQAKRFPKSSLQLSFRYHKRLNTKKIGKLYNSAIISRIDLYDVPFIEMRELEEFSKHLPIHLYILKHLENSNKKTTSNNFYINSYNEHNLLIEDHILI